ncbi:MAG: response regulator [Eubacteriales bacterium]
MKERIYIAEDEYLIRETVKAFLESENYEVIDFNNGDLLFEEFKKDPCDLIILDVLMPGSSGFEITKKIRDMSTVPIIILTAKDSDLDYATGINLGSDDYFTYDETSIERAFENLISNAIRYKKIKLLFVVEKLKAESW